MMIRQAYRFALDPSASQEQMLRSHAGAARFAWNWGLARCQERYAAEGKWYSAIDPHLLWNTAKKANSALAWWSENSKCACQEAFRDLERALRDFIKSKNGLRKGKRLGFPKSKKRGKCKDSFRFGAGVMRCTGMTVTLPRLGIIRTHEPARKLARRLENGTVRIWPATVTRTAQRRFVSFAVEVERAIPERHARPGSAIGVDLGVRTLLTGADDAGNVIRVPGPKPSFRLARAVAGQGFGTARRMLGYKAAGKGGQLVIAGRWHPGSKTCSACGWRKPGLTLAERIFTCEAS
jgi:putative transposase